MSSVGPTLPPHLKQKRKRGDEADDVPHSTNSRSRSSSIDSTKKRRVHGPSMPPASLDERPSTSPSPQPNVSKDPPATGDAASNSDSDSDFGPAPAPAGSGGGGRPSLDATTMDATSNEPQKPQREEWMLAPPSHSDWTSRLDPTKLRNRKFNTGKGAKGPSQSGSTDNRLWTETPEQKRQRLADEVMGTKKPAQMEEGPKKPPRNEAEDRETERKIREYNVSDSLTTSKATLNTSPGSEPGKVPLQEAQDGGTEGPGRRPERACVRPREGHRRRGHQFHQAERADQQGIGFRFPLREGKLSVEQ